MQTKHLFNGLKYVNAVAKIHMGFVYVVYRDNARRNTCKCPVRKRGTNQINDVNGSKIGYEHENKTNEEGGFRNDRTASVKVTGSITFSRLNTENKPCLTTKGYRHVSLITLFYILHFIFKVLFGSFSLHLRTFPYFLSPFLCMIGCKL